MTRLARLVFAMILLALGGASALAAERAAPGPLAPKSLAIVDVAVIDGTGSPAVPHRTVLIDAGRITAVTASSARPPARYRRLDGRGRTLIPGLWDMHVHAEWSASSGKAFFPRFVAWGVTTVRDMGGNEQGREAATAFARASPDWSPKVYRAGRLLDGPEPVDPSISIAVSTPEEARAAVDRLADQGVDFIKVYTLLPHDAFLAAADQAHRRGLKIVGHLPDGVTVEEAIAARMDGIEHMVAERGGYCGKDERRGCAPIFAALARARIAQTPTLFTRSRRGLAAYHPEWADQPELTLMPADVQAYWRGYLKDMAAATPERASMRLTDFSHERWMASGLIEAGAIIMVGTGTGTPFVYPGASIHDELAELVKAGLAPLRALAAATSGAARFMGARDSGRIAPGCVADLVLLDADPSADIAATRRIRVVIRAGVVHDRAALDAALASR